MKRLLCLLVVFGFIFSGCSNPVVDEINDSSDLQTIGFKTLRDNINTRSANDDGNDYEVYAIRSGSSSWYFNTSVTPSPNNGDDSTSETYYWPATGTVSFYAFCPVPAANNIVTGDIKPGSSIPITYTVPAKADQDFTIATPVTGKNSGTVALQFQHMLSKIRIELVLDPALSSSYSLDTAYTTSLTVSYNQGTIDAFNATTSTESGPWSLISSSNPVTYSGNTTYIIMPQQLRNSDSLLISNVVINYNDEPFFSGNLKPIALTTASSIFDNAFLPGKYYLLTVTINSASHGGNPDNPDNPIFNGAITFVSSADA